MSTDCPTLPGRFTLTDYPGRDAVGPNGERPMPMSKEYTFADGQYRMEGYPSLTITGRYAVAETDGTRVRLALTETIFDGTPKEDAEVWLAFSDCGKTMAMDGMTYRRLE